MCDWEGCTTGTIELPNPKQRRVVKTSGFLHPYIYRYTARVPRDRFLAFEGEGITWMRQPSRQGIALFSVRMEFWRSTAAHFQRTTAWSFQIAKEHQGHTVARWKRNQFISGFRPSEL